MATDEKLPRDAVFIDGRWFKDAQGRTLQLRGVNVSGNAKLPMMAGATTHDQPTADWFNHREVSFVGRPFPLEEAHEHLQRLQQWGFTLLRFCITWEAIEHGGPGIYDTAYAEYIVKVLQIVKLYSPLRVFIDPHQDCWSRFTGGSGAPVWTLELVGFDLKVLTDDSVGCAIVQNTYGTDEEAKQNYPKMIWPTNYFKLGCLTMFTMFFAGDAFFPKCRVVDDKMIISTQQVGQSIQEYLQEHYMNSVSFLIEQIKILDASLLDAVVIGYDSLNEPSAGLVGYETLMKFSKHHELKIGGSPTVLESLLVGCGLQVEVEDWKFGSVGPQKSGYTVLNPNRLTVWRSGYKCPYQAHGIYSLNSDGTATMFKDDYFLKYNGKEADFTNDFWLPFAVKYTQVVRQHHPQAIIFAEPAVNEVPPDWRLKSADRVAYAPHWYDGVTLMNKSFSTWWNVDYVGYKRHKYLTILGALHFGYNGVKSCYKKQLGYIKQEGLDMLGEVPCVIGEIGIPFDMDDKAAYKSQDALRKLSGQVELDLKRSRQRNGQSTVRRLIQYIAPNFVSEDPYKKQKQALDCNIQALEYLLLNFTLWNYCPTNTHQWGDQWNNEDLSLWSRNDEFRSPKPFETSSQSSRRSRMTQQSAGPLIDTSSSLTDSTMAPRDRSQSSPLQYISSVHPSIELNKGARGLAAFCRPYPKATCGTPLSYTFKYDAKDKEFLFTFQDSQNKFGQSQVVGTGTEIYVPLFHYGKPLDKHLFSLGAITKQDDGYFPYSKDEESLFDDEDDEEDSLYFDVEVSDGKWTYNADSQTLHYFHSEPLGIYGESQPGVHQIAISLLSRSQVKRKVSAAQAKSNCVVQ